MKEKPNIKRIHNISRNFFLHIHAPKVHPHSLQITYSFGLGIILAFLFIIMIITGFILMIHYTPSVNEAYNSVKDIVFVVPGGRIIRNIHRWAAHGLVLVAFLHMARTFYTGSYYGLRRVNWIIGVVMLLVVLFMNFSGYLLPWDQLAYWAVTIGSNIAASARELTDLFGITQSFDIGGFFKKLLIGDEMVGQPALTRFFMLHVIFLPLTLLILSGWHFWRIRKDGGLSRPLGESAFEPAVVSAGDDSIPSAVETKEESASLQVRKSSSSGNVKADDQDKRLYSWPVLMWIELFILVFVVATLLIMAFVFDAPLREQANPAFPENPAKSPWYFLGIQELVSYSAFTGGLMIPLMFIVFLLSIPYIDDQAEYKGMWFSSKKGKNTLMWSFLFSLSVTILLIYISIMYGWLRTWFDGIPAFFVMLVNPATLAALFYIAWSLIIRSRTGSTRMAAIALFTCALTGLIIFTALGIWFRGPNWEFYWSPSQWPAI